MGTLTGGCGVEEDVNNQPLMSPKEGTCFELFVWIKIIERKLKQRERKGVHLPLFG